MEARAALQRERALSSRRRRAVGSLVLGIDGARSGWVAVALRDGAFHVAAVARDLTRLLDRFTDVSAIGIDMPIGIPERGPREADTAARALLGGRRSSVFVVPPRAVLEAEDYASALRRCRALHAPGVSPQAYGLRHRIFEVEQFAATMPHLFEVHPEVSFHTLNGGPLAASKHPWDGFRKRRKLLAGAGIRVPDESLELRGARPDDVLDAAVAAWTALRLHRKTAQSLPAEPPLDARGRRVVIWY